MANFVISSPIHLPNHPMTMKVSEVMENPGRFLYYEDETGDYVFHSSCTSHVYRQEDKLYYQNSLAPILGRHALRVWEARLADLRRRYATFPKQFRDFYWELEKRAAYDSLEEIAADIFGEGFDPLYEGNQWRFFYCARVLERLRHAEDMVELLGGEETCRFEDCTVNRDAFFAEELRKIASFLDD